jgi:hypothetical protein
MINRMYHTWIRRIQQLRPGERITRIRNLVWLMLGLLESKNVALSKIAVKIPGRAKTLSIDRRLRRFLDNEKIHVEEWYQPVALEWLAAQGASTGLIRLIIDSTKIGHGYQLLMIALAFRRRAIPIAWIWLKHKKGKGRAKLSEHLELLQKVHELIPNNLPVLLVGDAEFGLAAILRQLDEWGWLYVLRQRGYSNIQEQEKGPWNNLREILTNAGQWRWLPNVQLTKDDPAPSNLLAYWQLGEEEPWLLATNLDDPHRALRLYRRREWIEEMFGDWKGHGFDVEQTRLRSADRLGRLILAVALLFDWLVSTGELARQHRTAHWVDRNDRFDLSIFQTGLRLVERALTNHLPVAIRLCPT